MHVLPPLAHLLFPPLVSRLLALHPLLLGHQTLVCSLQQCNLALQVCDDTLTSDDSKGEAEGTSLMDKRAGGEKGAGHNKHDPSLFRT